MRVNPVTNNTCSPKFGMWLHDVYNKKNNGSKSDGSVKHRNDTWLYRDGAYWKFFTDFISERFKDTPKVNTYCYGCSNGSEPYTLAMQILSTHPNEANKFLPVKAMDYDAAAIESAKSGIIPLTEIEIEYAKFYTKGQLNDFIDISEKNKSFFDLKSFHCLSDKLEQSVNIPNVTFDKKPDLENLKNGYYKVSPALKQNIDFKVANILHDYRKIQPKNSIVIARNFMPYLEPQNVVQLIYNIGNRLKSNSLLVLGCYDMEVCPTVYNIDMIKLINLAGFRQTKLANVFEKIERVRF